MSSQADTTARHDLQNRITEAITSAAPASLSRRRIERLTNATLAEIANWLIGRALTAKPEAVPGLIAVVAILEGDPVHEVAETIEEMRQRHGPAEDHDRDDTARADATP